MATKNKKQSLAEKISSLITAAPTNFGSDDDEAEETKAKVVEQFDESESDDNDEFCVSSSSIRRKNLDLLDAVDDRYRGKKVAKKNIYGNDSDDFDDDNGQNDDNDDEDDDESAQSENASVEEEGSDDDDDEEEEKEDDEDEGEDGSDNESEGSNSDDNKVDDENPLYRKREQNKNFKNMTVNNPRDDIEKGNCVREQLKMWENLLEMRIQLQKCLTSSNKLPQFDVYKEYEVNKEFVKSKNQTRNKLMELLENMLQVQVKLLEINPETKKLSDQMQNKTNSESEQVKDDPMDEEICSDTEDEREKDEEYVEEDQSGKDESMEPAKKKRKTLEEYEKILNDNHQKYIPYRNSVIQLWNDKTRVASGNINKGINQSVVKQIEFILNDKSKIIRKSQLKRSEYEIVGKSNKNTTSEIVDNRRNQEYDSEIYDDDDFYHQLLRELIQHKSADVTDPIQLSKQWIQLQNMRNKMKKKVNTKESKGRRIRYGQVHNKLVNFMAPITIDDAWSSLAKTELYNSLFGKIKCPDGNMNDKIVVDNDKL